MTAIGLEVDARAARRGEESQYTLALAPGPGDVGLSVGLSF